MLNESHKQNVLMKTNAKIMNEITDENRGKVLKSVEQQLKTNGKMPK